MDRRSLEAQLLILTVFYHGPWGRLADWCYGLREDNTLRWEIPAHPKGWRWALAKLGNWAEERDRTWRAKYAIRRKTPHKRWKRRSP